MRKTPTSAKVSLTRDTLADRVTEWLSEQIILGTIASNEVITESDLAKQLGISRSPVREAIRELVREGLLAITPQRRVMVMPLDREDGAELYECRAVLEGFCSRVAATAIPDEGLIALRSIYEQMKIAAEAPRVSEYQELNMRFHRTLYEYCPNRAVLQLVQLLWRKTQRYRAILSQEMPWNKQRIRTSLHYHAQIMDALETRDGEMAEQALRALILSARQELQRILAERVAPASPGLQA